MFHLSRDLGEMAIPVPTMVRDGSCKAGIGQSIGALRPLEQPNCVLHASQPGPCSDRVVDLMQCSDETMEKLGYKAVST
jgi:hypothetical protein